MNHTKTNKNNAITLDKAIKKNDSCLINLVKKNGFKRKRKHKEKV